LLHTYSAWSRPPHRRLQIGGSPTIDMRVCSAIVMRSKSFSFNISVLRRNDQKRASWRRDHETRWGDSLGIHIHV
jgi:hypothetical protein